MMPDPLEPFTGSPTIGEGVGLVLLSVALTGCALVRAATKRLRSAW